MSANPKANKKPTTNPTKYLHQYLADKHFKRPFFAHAWCKNARAVWLHSPAILGLAGLGEAFGRHGWIVFCGGVVRIVCTLTSKNIRLNIHIDSTVERFLF